MELHEHKLLCHIKKKHISTSVWVVEKTKKESLRNEQVHFFLTKKDDALSIYFLTKRKLEANNAFMTVYVVSKRILVGIALEYVNDYMVIT